MRLVLFYRGATWLLAAVVAAGAVADLLGTESVLDVLRRLGYPDYLATILGAAKLLAVLTIVVPGFRTLKEWAYAGLTFDLLGAFLSHLSVGDPAKDAMVPLGVLALTLVSYGLYRKQLKAVS